MYNPGISFVFSIAKKYHDALHSGEEKLTNVDVSQIKRMFGECVAESQFLDYHSATTYLVVEILVNILQRRIQMAQSLYGILEFAYSEYDVLVTEPNIGIPRIEEFRLLEADEPCVDVLKSEPATEILLGLYDMQYRFHEDFLQHCSTKFRTMYYL